jgi:hypothetical protein
MNEDLIVALENAIQRGSSLEDAKSSLLNAGYPSGLVEEASHYVHLGILPIISQTEKFTEERLEPKSSNIKIILLSIVLVLLLGALGTIIFFKDYFNNLLGFS